MTLEQWEHKRTIGTLVFTLGTAYQRVADEIELASRRRGQAMYDRVGVAES